MTTMLLHHDLFHQSGCVYSGSSIEFFFGTTIGSISLCCGTGTTTAISNSILHLNKGYLLPNFPLSLNVVSLKGLSLLLMPQNNNNSTVLLPVCTLDDLSWTPTQQQQLLQLPAPTNHQNNQLFYPRHVGNWWIQCINIIHLCMLWMPPTQLIWMGWAQFRNAIWLSMHQLSMVAEGK